ncbi:SpoIIE family protein phosphatase [Rubinisphaera sp.]|uniref:PP2C family protein-serine/threonine phosphatase n=1 Tax=Rubinisphaera sp. TaxID=2024857 RepID=UPI000C0CEBF0|nr:SpoIIE family protein phosphatase [Rubinisphaera sp.]MBV11186.1 hypothetical protein [Rubinisphaera sp.]HCS51018.1 hypothetical protein [Planctomycetaceae bacterium]|tara:strand:+ start:1815 stop:3275 length:1461 start_codon:yes stop_codon:yes gene_type:complete
MNFRLRDRSIRFRLLSITSIVTFCFVIALVVLDYRREVQHHFTAKQSDLYEEAKTILPGIVHTREHGRVAVQNYIDDVCSRMDEQDSPSHHIAIQIDDEFYEAFTYSKEALPRLEPMNNASSMGDLKTHLGGNDEFLVGIYSDGNISVLVTEDVTALRSAIVGDELFRIAGIILMGIAAATIVHRTLIRLVSKPLDVLVEKVRAVGKGVYDNPIGEFGSLELNILSTEINYMSEALATSEVDRNSQLKKARKIQQNLLPNGIEIPGVNIGKIYCPAEEVGGDYLDILPQGNNRWLVCVADATGHGVPAAMSSAMLKTLLLQINDGDKSPAMILREINKVFMQVHVFGDFASVVLLQLDMNAMTLTYTNAGHDPAWYIKSPTEIQELKPTGTLLGIHEDESWEEYTIQIDENSRFAVSTDGITETFNSEGREFGKERLLDSLLLHASSSVAETATLVHETVRDFRATEQQMDDVTLLLIEFFHQEDD